MTNLETELLCHDMENGLQSCLHVTSTAYLPEISLRIHT